MAIQTITAEAFEEFVNRTEHADQRFELIGGEIAEVPPKLSVRAVFPPEA